MYDNNFVPFNMISCSFIDLHVFRLKHARNTILLILLICVWCWMWINVDNPSYNIIITSNKYSMGRRHESLLEKCKASMSWYAENNVDGCRGKNKIFMKLGHPTNIENRIFRRKHLHELICPVILRHILAKTYVVQVVRNIFSLCVLVVITIYKPFI